MQIYEFTLNIGNVSILSNQDLLTISEALYSGACNDAFVSSIDEAMYIEFEREAESLDAAIVRAIKLPCPSKKACQERSPLATVGYCELAICQRQGV